MKQERKNWFTFLTRDSHYQFPGMTLSVLTMGAIVAFLVFLHEQFGVLSVKIPSSFHTVLGLVTGLLLVFRTNTAYDRWWEGRKQLGTLLNTCRCLILKYDAFLEENLPEKRILQQLIIAFAWSMKQHLRDADYLESGRFLPKIYENDFHLSNHKPMYVLDMHMKVLNKLRKEQTLLGEHLIVLEKEIAALVSVLGACERIRNTPIPMGYGLHLKRILLLYIITLPIGFIEDLSWGAVPIIMIVFYTMVGIELIGEEIEDPFGTDPNDLPVDMIVDRITNNSLEFMDTIAADEVEA